MLQLYELRMQAGVSQKRLASDLKMSTGNLCDWEKGRTEPDIEKLIKLADYFDVSLDELMGREPRTLSKEENLNAKNRYKLIDSFEKLSPTLQRKLLDFLEELTALQ
ncbi:MAG: helix-turn-helix transcriptional regulator [Clostridia bacterium]|nr:helix-turn-helix transcriptional regulator [Clostridia bacterium]